MAAGLGRIVAALMAECARLFRPMLLLSCQRSRTSQLPLVIYARPGASTGAKETGYVFVSHQKTNNIAVIDPKQDYTIIQTDGVIERRPLPRCLQQINVLETLGIDVPETACRF